MAKNNEAPTPQEPTVGPSHEPVAPEPTTPEPPAPAPSVRAARKAEAPAEEMVALPKATLEQILADQAEAKREIARLTAAADIGRLAKYDSQHESKKNTKTCRVSFYDDKPVVGWKMTQDEVYTDGQGVYHERQTVQLILLGGETREMPYRDSIRRIEKRDAEIVRRSTTEDGETVTVRLEGLEPLELDIRFIN